MRSTRNRDSKVDWLLVMVYLFIVLFGWMNIYSASVTDETVGTFSFASNYGRQLIWIGLSFFAAFIIMFFDSKFFPAFSYIIFGVSLVLLAAVLVIGQTVSGSKSWFVITEAIKFQPSEFGKFATSLALAKYMGDKNFSFSNKREAITALVIFGVPALLILLENDTGSTIAFASLFLVFYREGMTGLVLVTGVILAALFLLNIVVNQTILIGVILFIALIIIVLVRKNKGLILITILLAGFFIGYLYGTDYIFENVLQPHQQTRVKVLLGLEKDLKGAGYNVHQSKIAIGSGGLVGKGFLEGTQTRYRFVPKQYTDFIFSVVGEEWGFIGSVFLVLIYLLLLIKIVLNAERQKSRYSRIYGYCVAAILFAHFSINIGMAIGLLPTIGIPLPMVSYGGSSLFSFTILLFVFIKLDSNRSVILS